MRVRDLMAHFREIGTWVDWEISVDRVLHGDAETQVRGIAAAWIASEYVARTAAARGLNLIVSHEGLYWDEPNLPETAFRALKDRCKLYDELGVTVVRCHDVWDRMPEFGIGAAWAQWLGFEIEDQAAIGDELGPKRAYYSVCMTGGMTVGRLAEEIAKRCAPLGQSAVFLAGDSARAVERLAVGTGAFTPLHEMMQLEPDAMLVTDDGNRWTRDCLCAEGLGVPLIWVTHPVSELPGMIRMVEYLAERFPRVRTEYVPVEFPRTVRGD